MRSLTTAAAILALSVTLSGRALSQSKDVYSIQALYEECTSGQVVTQGICIGYIQGVADTMTASDSVVKAKGLDFNLGWCPAPDVTTDQVVQVFKNWYTRNPNSWHEYKVLGVIAALQESWPCKH